MHGTTVKITVGTVQQSSTQAPKQHTKRHGLYVCVYIYIYNAYSENGKYPTFYSGEY
jgi:hypothetical protein